MNRVKNQEVTISDVTHALKALILNGSLEKQSQLEPRAEAHVSLARVFGSKSIVRSIVHKK